MGFEFQLVQLEVVEDIAILKLCDPPANALTYDMVKQLENLFIELSLTPAVKCIILTGQGERFFSGGVNIGMLRSACNHYNSNFILYASEVFRFIEDMNKPVIAAINGHITGGGLELALVATKRIAVDKTYNFGFPEVRLGVIPGLGGTQRLSKLVGIQTALELITQGEFVSPERAVQLGIIESLYPAENFLPNTVEFAKREFCGPGAPEQNDSATSTSRIKEELFNYDQRTCIYRKEGNVGIIDIDTVLTQNQPPLANFLALNNAILQARLDETVEAILIAHTGDTLTLGDANTLDSAGWTVIDYVLKKLENLPRLCFLASTNLSGALATELALACDYRLVLADNESAIAPIQADARSKRIARFSPVVKLGDDGTLVSTNQHNHFFKLMTNKGATLPEVLAWIARFTSPQGASQAIGYAKFSIVHSQAESIDAGVAIERHLQEQLFVAHDGLEGMQAYLEKRSPSFTGA